MVRQPWVILAALGACAGSDDAREPAFQLLGDEPAAMLSVWGTSTKDVWVTGGKTEIDGAPTLLHYDGRAWTRVDSGQTGIDLWWSFGVPGSSMLYLGGSNGTILRGNAAGFEKMTTPSGGIVFGIWGPTDNDLWAVGANQGAGFAWHYDGAAWTAMTLPSTVSGRLFKVHGQASNDVWIAGSANVTLHWNGSELAHVTSDLPAPLFSIITTPVRAIAVGGLDGDGAILEWTGSAWQRDPVVAPAPWRGVAANDRATFAVGESGLVAHRDDVGWSTMSQTVVQRDFHAAWIDPVGGLWGVGGDFDRIPLTANGFVIYYGEDRPNEVP